MTIRSRLSRMLYAARHGIAATRVLDRLQKQSDASCSRAFAVGDRVISVHCRRFSEKPLAGEVIAVNVFNESIDRGGWIKVKFDEVPEHPFNMLPSELVWERK